MEVAVGAEFALEGDAGEELGEGDVGGGEGDGGEWHAVGAAVDPGQAAAEGAIAGFADLEDKARILTGGQRALPGADEGLRAEWEGEGWRG